MCLGDSVPPRPAGQSPLVWLTISVMLVTIIIGGVVMGSLYTDNTNLSHRLNVLEGEMLVIRDMIAQVQTDQWGFRLSIRISDAQQILNKLFQTLNITSQLWILNLDTSIVFSTIFVIKKYFEILSNLNESLMYA